MKRSRSRPPPRPATAPGTRPQPQGSAASTPPLELALGVLGAAVVAILAGYLLFSALTGTGSGRPDILIIQASPLRVAEGWLLPFTATNDGQAPAGQLRLAAALDLGDGRQETGELVIDYLAPQSSQTAGFFFTAEPRPGAVTVRAVSYVEP